MAEMMTDNQTCAERAAGAVTPEEGPHRLVERLRAEDARRIASAYAPLLEQCRDALEVLAEAELLPHETKLLAALDAELAAAKGAG